MEHTFLFSEGTWASKGLYYDEFSNPVPVSGQSIIKHKDNVWTNEGYMVLELNNPIRFDNRYEYTQTEKDFTGWTSFNPALGTLQGKFTFIDDTIISTYISDNGQYSGVECMVKINDTTYTSKGFAFNGSEKLSSWSVVLKKI